MRTYDYDEWNRRVMPNRSKAQARLLCFLAGVGISMVLLAMFLFVILVFAKGPG